VEFVEQSLWSSPKHPLNTIGQCEDMVLKMQCIYSWLNMEALLGLKGGGFSLTCFI